jgi:hypothetical protein
MALAPNAVMRDVLVSVRLRGVGGHRAGGVVWRYLDPENYYAAILDLTRQEIAMYRVSRGNRVRLEDEEDLEVDAGAWHSLKVVHRDSETRVSLDGIPVFEERTNRDDRGGVPGRVGLIAGGDAEIWFDDLHAGSPPPRRGPPHQD